MRSTELGSDIEEKIVTYIKSNLPTDDDVAQCTGRSLNFKPNYNNSNTSSKDRKNLSNSLNKFMLNTFDSKSKYSDRTKLKNASFKAMYEDIVFNKELFFANY